MTSSRTSSTTQTFPGRRSSPSTSRCACPTRPRSGHDNASPPQIEKHSKDSQNPISVRAISQTPRTQRWSSVAEQSYKQAGFSKYDDVNGGPMLGYTELVENVDDKGTRSSANGYFGATVDPAKTRLEIWTGLRVSKILFSEEQPPRAIGVQTSAGAVHAKREVVRIATLDTRAPSH